MFDWLEDPQANGRLEWGDLLFRLAAGFVMGCLVAGIYRLTTRRGQGSGLPGTLVLLGVLVAMVMVVIGNNLARAFGLVGALGIVRFRTVVDDARDTAFVMAAVALGMACGAGYRRAPLAVLPLVLAAAWLFRPTAEAVGGGPQRLGLRLGTGAPTEQEVHALLKHRLPGCRLAALATVRGGAALDVTYLIPPLAGEEALALVAELNRIEGVQAVELKGE